MILDEIAAKTRVRIEERKQEIAPEIIKAQAEKIAEREKQQGAFTFPFEQALKKNGISFICEVKKASPSKGVIAEDFPYLAIAKEYEEAGASALSVLTEPYYFMGSNDYLKEIASQVQIPILRKDYLDYHRL